MAIDRKHFRSNQISQAREECHDLLKKLNKVYTYGSRTTNSYNSIYSHLHKIQELIDYAFDVKVKIRVQKDLRKVIEDVMKIGYDEL